jgi:hypothetical protein
MVGRSPYDFDGGIPTTEHFKIDRLLRDFLDAFGHCFSIFVSFSRQFFWMKFNYLNFLEDALE